MYSSLNLDRIFVLFESVFLLLIMPCLYKIGYSDFGFGLFMGAVLVFFAITMKRGYQISLSFFAYGFLLLIWMILVFLLFNSEGITRIIQYVCLLTIIITNQFVKWKKYDLVLLKSIANIVVWMALIWLPMTDFNMYRYSAFFSHSNYLGSILFHTAMILILTRSLLHENSKILFFGSQMAILFLIAISNSRAALFSYLILISMCFLLNSKNEGNKKKYNFFILMIIVFASMFTVIYPKLVNTDLGTTLELFSRQYLTKNFFSGREILWNEIIDMINMSPVFGYGLSAKPSNFMDTSFSSHNLWLQLTLQMGLVGLGLFIMFLNCILVKIKEGKLAVIGVSYFCALVFHECFEVTLTQNEFSTGVISWMIFGIILSDCRNGIKK